MRKDIRNNYNNVFQNNCCNRAEETIISNFEKQRAVINYDGKVHWEPGGNFRTTCDVDIW